MRTGPAVVPDVRTLDAWPDAFATACAGFRVPPPDMIVNETVAPGTAFSRLSRASTTSGWPSGCPTVPDWSFPLTMSSVPAAPGAAVAVKVAAGIAVPSMRAVADCGPAAPPRIHTVDARPVALVVVRCESNCPCPSQRTVAPATGFPYWSTTLATSGCGNEDPTTPSWPLPPATAIAVAALA